MSHTPYKEATVLQWKHTNLKIQLKLPGFKHIRNDVNGSVSFSLLTASLLDQLSEVSTFLSVSVSALTAVNMLCLCGSITEWHQESLEDCYSLLFTPFLHKLEFRILNGSLSSVWDFMVSDNSGSVFSVHPPHSLSDTRFLISGLKEAACHIYRH